MKTTKTKSRLFAVLATVCAAVTMLVCALGLTACGSDSVAGTYTYTETGTTLKTNTHGGGFIDSLIHDGSKLTVTLELKDDNTYVLTKNFELVANDTVVATVTAMGVPVTKDDVDIKLNFVYTGNYTAEKDAVTLGACNKVTYKEAWGVFENFGIQSAEGEFTSAGTANATISEDYMATFPTMYLRTSTDGNVEQKITLKGSSFEYVVENLDD